MIIKMYISTLTDRKEIEKNEKKRRKKNIMRCIIPSRFFIIRMEWLVLPYHPRLFRERWYRRKKNGKSFFRSVKKHPHNNPREYIVINGDSFSDKSF